MWNQYPLDHARSYAELCLSELGMKLSPRGLVQHAWGGCVCVCWFFLRCLWQLLYDYNNMIL